MWGFLGLGVSIFIGAAFFFSQQRLEKLKAKGLELEKSKTHQRKPSRKVLLLIWYPRGVDAKGKGQEIHEKVQNLMRTFKRDEFEIYVLDPTQGSTWALNLSAPSPRIDAHVAFDDGVDSAKVRIEVERALADSGCTSAAFSVEQSIYTDYGEYNGPATAGWDPKQKPNWVSGEASKHIIAHTCLSKNNHISKDEFVKRWHGVQSPMSEVMQPRSRYVRNLVLKGLSENAPDYDGIIIEAWPTLSHQRNPFLFFNASNPFDLLTNILVMLRSTFRFAKFSSIQQSPMQEFVFKKGL